MTDFECNIRAQYGQEGQDWLLQLPSLVNKLAEKYKLSQLKPADNSSFNYVVFADKHSQPVVLKLGLNEKALQREVDCLRAFQHHGAVGLLESEPGVILLKRVLPGETLRSYFPNRERDAAAIFAEVVNELHEVKIDHNHSFLKVQELLAEIDLVENLPEDTIAKAQVLREHLLKTTKQTVLLHGDLHHENILSSYQNWSVIDPKGFVGDPLFETSAFLCNPISELANNSSRQQIIMARIELVAKFLNADPERILQWLFVKLVLMIAWQEQDGLVSTEMRQLLSSVELYL